MPSRRFVRTALFVLTIAAGVPAARAVAQPVCAQNEQQSALQEARRIRQEHFDTFRSQLINADQSSATPAAGPLNITGGFTKDTATAKVLVSQAIRFVTLSWNGTVTGQGTNPINVLDSSKYPTDYSSKVAGSWSHWKNAVPEARLRTMACPALQGSLNELRAADVGRALVVSGSYEIGRKTLTFADPANDYRDASERHRVQTFTGTGGVVLGEATDGAVRTTVLATYTHSRGYSAGSTTTQLFCHPIGTAGATACGKNPLPAVAPVPKPTNAVQLEGRVFPAWPISPGARYTRNITEAIDVIEAPIYFIRKDADPKSKYAFTGGVTVGYRDGGTDRGRFVAVFFGTEVLAKPEPKKP